MARKAKNGSGKPRGKRRSKGEDSTGAKENTAEMRKASDLPLGEPVILDDADFDMHLRSLKGAKERMATAKNLYDGVCKAAKKVSDNLLTAIKRAVKFEGMDAEDIKRQMEIDGYVLKRAGSPVQLTIHDTLMGDVTQAAELRGYKDAVAGRVAGAVYPEGSDLHALYMKGWARGTAENLGIPSEEIDDTLLPGDNGARQLREEASVN